MSVERICAMELWCPQFWKSGLIRRMLYGRVAGGWRLTRARAALDDGLAEKGGEMDGVQWER